MNNLYFLDSWRDFAACTDASADLFFPEKGDSVTARAAKRICATCPSRLPCLDYALDTRQFDGVWGGTTERDRRRILRQRNARPEVEGEGVA